MVDKLIEDHALVAGIVRRIRELLTADPAALGSAALGSAALVRELDGLTAILESHFGYEERRISRALDALGPGGWIKDVFAP